MKNKFLLFFISLFIFSCSKEKNIQIADSGGEEIIFTSSDLEHLTHLEKTKSFEVRNGILSFKNNDIYLDVMELFYKMKPSEYLDYIKTIGFHSYYEWLVTFDEPFESANLENKDLFYLEGDRIIDNVFDSRIINIDGLKIIDEGLVFNTYDFTKACFIGEIEDDTELTYNYFKSNIDSEIFYESPISTRLCTTTDWNFYRTYDYDGKQRAFETIIQTWAGLNPVYNGQYYPTGWNVTGGYKYENISHRWAPWKRGWGVDWYCKIQGGITGTNDYQWNWKTCNDCKRLDHSELAYSFYVDGSPIPSSTRPRFDNLDWHVSQITNVFGVTEFDDINTPPGGPPTPCASGYGSDIPRYCLGCSN